MNFIVKSVQHTCFSNVVFIRICFWRIGDVGQFNSCSSKGIIKWLRNCAHNYVWSVRVDYSTLKQAVYVTCMFYQVKMHRTYMGVYITSWIICSWEFLRTFEKCMNQKVAPCAFLCTFFFGGGWGQGGLNLLLLIAFTTVPFLLVTISLFYFCC